MSEIRGIIFDKDGTLFDFGATWGAWTSAFLSELSGGDDGLATRLGRAVGFDVIYKTFQPNSVVIAGTPDEIAAALLPHLPGESLTALVSRMNTAAADTPLVEAVPLRPLLTVLHQQQGLKIGLATNDGELPARAHLAASGIADEFDFVAGSDSGFGAKPKPGMLLAFAKQFGLSPQNIAMIGDSLHDLSAARSAGMHAVAVLTGPATERELAPLADVVLPDIGHLPAWVSSVLAPA